MRPGPQQGFFQRIQLDETTGCWNWGGPVFANGYGSIRYDKRQVYVHRVSAHLYLGFDLNSPLHVLHRCDNRKCFNPKHLFIGTRLENMRDARDKGRLWQMKRTHCPKGHPYSGSNLYIRPGVEAGRSKRGCRICRNRASKKFKTEENDLAD